MHVTHYDLIRLPHVFSIEMQFSSNFGYTVKMQRDSNFGIESISVKLPTWQRHVYCIHHMQSNSI